jgi:hypothetical protein
MSSHSSCLNTSVFSTSFSIPFPDGSWSAGNGFYVSTLLLLSLSKSLLIFVSESFFAVNWNEKNQSKRINRIMKWGEQLDERNWVGTLLCAVGTQVLGLWVGRNVKYLKRKRKKWAAGIFNRVYIKSRDVIIEFDTCSKRSWNSD